MMRRASDRTPGLRTRALIVLLWRVGLRINEALSLAAGSEAVSHDLELAGDAPREQLEELVSQVDAIAEIPNSVRRGTPVKLSSVRIVPE